MKPVLILLTLLALPVNAQQLPESPAPETSHPPHKVIDRKFLAVMGIEALAKSADAMTTAKHMREILGVEALPYVHSCQFDYPTGHCWQYYRFHETNPIFGTYPSNRRLIGESIPIYAGEAALTYFLKRKHFKFWWAPAAYFAANHTYWAAHNTRY